MSCAGFGSEKVKVLIIDGIYNHDWKNTSIATKATLEQTGEFTVDVCTSPSRNAPKEEWKTWRLQFFDYGVIVSNFNDEYPPFGEAVDCVGYQTVLARGTEYVATGKVTIGIPRSFPGKKKAVVIAPDNLEWPPDHRITKTRF